MTNMKTFLLSCIIGTSLIATSCSSENEMSTNTNEGSIHLAVTTDAKFKTNTRVVNESSYADVNNYTVQIINSSNKVEKEFVYNETPEKINLNNGSYTLKAFYGEDSNASRKSFYVEGITTFAVEGNDKSISVDCAPVHGKVAVNFAQEMATYFSDYSVVYETEALTASSSTATWNKIDIEPWYLKVNKKGETVKATIHVTRLSDNKSSSVEKTYTLLPNKSWTLNIAPQDNNGNLGITITIDESTNDHEIDIVVPSEWL